MPGSPFRRLISNLWDAGGGTVFAGTRAETVTAAETQATTGSFGVSLAESSTATATQASVTDFGIGRAEVLVALTTENGGLGFDSSVSETLAVASGWADVLGSRVIGEATRVL